MFGKYFFVVMIIRPGRAFDLLQKYILVQIQRAEEHNFLLSRFFCELYFDKAIYAKTSSKTKSDLLFWGENFAFK